MADSANHRDRFSTCLEDSRFAETMQTRQNRQGTGPLLDRLAGQRAGRPTPRGTPNAEFGIVGSLMKLHRCSECPIRLRAIETHHPLFVRIHRWHMTWWPGWKIYLSECHARTAGASVTVSHIQENS